MGLEIEVIEVSDFQQNCRIIYDALSKRAVIFDPGGEAPKISRSITKLALKVEGIYLTHSHIDHCAAVDPLLKELKVPLYAHAAEEMFRKSVTSVAGMYGLSAEQYFNCPEPEVYLEDGMEIEIISVKTRVIATPGHSPGSISFWMPSEGLIISGDVLFYDSIGRSDLPGGEHATLLASIEKLVQVLPPETKVLSGHGPDTTIGREKEQNPFLN